MTHLASIADELDVTDFDRLRQLVADVAETPDHIHHLCQLEPQCEHPTGDLRRCEGDPTVSHLPKDGCAECATFEDALITLRVHAPQITRQLINSPTGLIDRAVRWVDGAGWGDAGEQPALELTYQNGRWEVEMRSFYDGCAAPDRNRSLAGALHEALDTLDKAPYLEKQRRLERAVRDLAGESGIDAARITDALHELGATPT